MRWLKTTILVLGFACVSERSATAQFFGPPGWGYGSAYPGGFGYGSFRRTIGFNISFGSGFSNYGYGGYGGYGYGPSYYPPYPVYRESFYFAPPPPPIVLVQQPPVIVIERPQPFQLRQNQQPNPGPIPPINGEVKPANLLVIRPEKQAAPPVIELPPPKPIADDEQLKQAEAELEAARQRLNALLRAKGK